MSDIVTCLHNAPNFTTRNLGKNELLKNKLKHCTSRGISMLDKKKIRQNALNPIIITTHFVFAYYVEPHDVL